MRNLILSSTALALMATGAIAGGYTAPVEEPVLSAPVPFVPESDWTGFYAGGQLGYGKAESDNGAFDADGAFGGVHLGYLHDFGNFVGGGELAYSAAKIENDNGPGELDAMTQLKLIGGVDQGDWLFYGTAGMARLNLTDGATDIADNGWLVGVGANRMIGNDWMVGGELLYTKASDFDGTGVDVDSTSLGLKASYRF